MIAKPLTDLLKKDAFKWSEEAQTAFDKLKEALTSAPVLAFPDPTKQFILETDASAGGLGAVLMQERHPVSFFSRAISPRQRAMSVYEKELLAIMMAVTTPLHHKWLVKLMGYNYVIEYKKGRENVAADALSRVQGTTLFTTAISHIEPLLLDRIMKSQNKDVEVYYNHYRYPMAFFYISMDFIGGLPKLKGYRPSCLPAYHPQTDGQTEVVNRCLEGYLRCMVMERPLTWTKWLSLAEWWYNTSFHSSLGRTPFEALYGYRPPLHISHIPRDVADQDVDELMRDREAAIKVLRQSLLKAQNRMKQQADKHRTERVFEPGSWVYLKLQPYMQNSLRVHKHLKLTPKYFGPFLIVENVGAVAYRYRLDLPSDALIHPVFHVLLLKEADVSLTKIIPIPEEARFSMARDMIIRNPVMELATTDELTRLAGYGEEKLSTVVVVGTLLCDAFLRKNSPLESHPIPGALVGVSCRRHTSVNRKTSRTKSSNWVVIKGKTDEYGDFHIDLPSHLHAIPNIEKRCFVRVLGIPKKSPCHQSALTNHKHKRIELLSSSGNGIRAYSTRGIHFMTHKRR
nr:Ty3/gypsy retrotransposon protein [Tanacetum cinerariifolium]